MTTNENSKISAAEKRYSEALVYLDSKGVDIHSITDKHYLKAIEIASGYKRVKKEVKR